MSYLKADKKVCTKMGCCNYYAQQKAAADALARARGQMSPPPPPPPPPSPGPPYIGTPSPPPYPYEPDWVYDGLPTPAFPRFPPSPPSPPNPPPTGLKGVPGKPWLKGFCHIPSSYIGTGAPYVAFEYYFKEPIKDCDAWYVLAFLRASLLWAASRLRASRPAFDALTR